MRWSLALLVLAGCRLGPEADTPAASETLRLVAVQAAPEAAPALDTLARSGHGDPIPADSFRTLAARVDTSTASGTDLLRGAGTFHGGEVGAQTGERWHGLYPSPRGLELRSFEIRVETAYDPLLDDEDGPFTGQRVVTPFSEPLDEYGNDFGDGSHVLVHRGGRPLRDGPVPTAFVGSWPLDAGGLQVTLGETYYTVSVAVGPEVRPGVRGARVVSLWDGERSQPLAHIVDRDGGSSALLWAGDLDRDGRLDLLLDETDHYNVGLPTLYLSSEAAPGALVRRVAQHHTVGC